MPTPIPPDSAQRLASLLVDVAAAEVTADAALAEWQRVCPRYFEYRVLAQAWHCLTHFQNDIDLRAKDSDYDSFQRGQLREWAFRITSAPPGVEEPR